MNALVGGRIFPGVHHHARFDVRETADRYSVFVASDDDRTRAGVVGRRTDGLPAGSTFATVEDASAFFEGGAIGFSPARKPGRMEALELCCRNRSVEPLAVERVESSFFDDRSLFPAGCAAFDCALLMRNIEHEWHSRPGLCCA